MRLSVKCFGFVATLLVPALFVGGCENDEPSALTLLGGGCLLNSDCDPGLACVFERCHIECNDSADCPLDEDGERLRCVVGEKPDHVCQLADEAKCAYHSECPGQQVCGPDGRCRDQCQDDRDCVDGQVCAAQGACADTDELDDGGELTGEVPPPEQETGFPCSYDSQCLGLASHPENPDLEFVCRNGGCAVDCYLSVDCEPGFACSEPSDRNIPGNCERQVFDCIPGEQKSCPCFDDDAPGVQVCADDGKSYSRCVRISDQTDCGPPG